MYASGLLTVIPFDFDKHYGEVSRWWAVRNYPAVPKELLSLGRIAFLGDTPLAAAWLFTSPQGLGFIGWTAGNPDAETALRGAGIQAVVKELLREAKKAGIFYVKAVCQNPSLEANYLATGAEITDQNISQLGWRV